MSKEIAEEYASSLADLTVNSKPLINMLTILAEENIDHAGVIVETVEKHLEKVNPDIKLPVLYLVDSIIKNVGGAYTTKFSQSIVNMFTRTFKQVDEKIRSQMFKLRETWHDVFPATKLYQLDVKVNLIDPAWPIQAQPQQSNIHVNPNFLKKTPTTSTAVVKEEDEKMRSIFAKKEQELLMLQKKKVEMELEQMRRQLELEKTAKKLTASIPGGVPSPSMPIALVNPVVAPALAPVLAPAPAPAPAPALAPAAPEPAPLPVRQRLGPPVRAAGGAGRIAPVSAALATARRDPRLARRAPAPAPAPAPAAPAPALPPALAPALIAPNVFDIKPLERSSDRVTKRKNVITIDVRPEAAREARRRDPRLDKRDRRRDERARRPAPAPGPGLTPPAPPPPALDRDDRRKEHKDKNINKLDDKSDERHVNVYMDKLQIADPKRINRLPPIPKLNREEQPDAPSAKRKKEPARDRKKKKDETNGKEKDKDSSSGSSPEKKLRSRDIKKKIKEPRVEAEAEKPDGEVVAFKELKNYNKERYMRRNKEKSESPERIPEQGAEAPPAADNESSSKRPIYVNRMRG